MAGKVVVSTLNNDTGVLATQNGMTGIAKAWVQFAGASPATIASSFNVSSVTYVTTGTYTVNFTNAMPNANYSAIAQISNSSAGAAAVVNIFSNNSSFAAPTASSFQLMSILRAAGLVDPVYVCVAVFSS